MRCNYSSLPNLVKPPLKSGHVCVCVCVGGGGGGEYVYIKNQNLAQFTPFHIITHHQLKLRFPKWDQK